MKYWKQIAAIESTDKEISFEFLGLLRRNQSQNYILQNKQYHVKVLLKRFHLNSNIHRISSMDSKIRATLFTVFTTDLGSIFFY